MITFKVFAEKKRHLFESFALSSVVKCGRMDEYELQD